MVELIWDERFKKIYKKWIRQHPELRAQFAKKIVLFAEDPFHPSLKTPYAERCPERSLVVQDYLRAPPRFRFY